VQVTHRDASMSEAGKSQKRKITNSYTALIDGCLHTGYLIFGYLMVLTVGINVGKT